MLNNISENMVTNLKYDGLIVYMNWKGQSAKNISKFIRSAINKPSGSIISELESMFKCSVVKNESDYTYTLTFASERDITFFNLHT